MVENVINVDNGCEQDLTVTETIHPKCSFFFYDNASDFASKLPMLVICGFDTELVVHVVNKKDSELFGHPLYIPKLKNTNAKRKLSQQTRTSRQGRNKIFKDIKNNYHSIDISQTKDESAEQTNKEASNSRSRMKVQSKQTRN